MKKKKAINWVSFIPMLLKILQECSEGQSQRSMLKNVRRKGRRQRLVLEVGLRKQGVRRRDRKAIAEEYLSADKEQLKQFVEAAADES